MPRRIQSISRSLLLLFYVWRELCEEFLHPSCHHAVSRTSLDFGVKRCQLAESQLVDGSIAEHAIRRIVSTAIRPVRFAQLPVQFHLESPPSDLARQSDGINRR